MQHTLPLAMPLALASAMMMPGMLMCADPASVKHSRM
ncbi:Uncharacterised protein [Actinobaculum suis]|uniref:Uncharacterized protein n=1 Tax=Actinobaculum suis TaxID=1657 RepID=A0A7Z9C983_9ACTO|nr:Uncharacterised protein [Actinobaculum suis]